MCRKASANSTNTLFCSRMKFILKSLWLENEDWHQTENFSVTNGNEKLSFRQDYLREPVDKFAVFVHFVKTFSVCDLGNWWPPEWLCHWGILEHSPVCTRPCILRHINNSKRLCRWFCFAGKKPLELDWWLRFMRWNVDFQPPLFCGFIYSERKCVSHIRFTAVMNGFSPKNLCSRPLEALSIRYVVHFGLSRSLKCVCCTGWKASWNALIRWRSLGKREFGVSSCKETEKVTLVYTNREYQRFYVVHHHTFTKKAEWTCKNWQDFSVDLKIPGNSWKWLQDFVWKGLV